MPWKVSSVQREMLQDDPSGNIHGFQPENKREEMKLAYLDCFSGISGDMMLGALLDLGLPEKVFREELARLPIEGYDIHVRRDFRGAVGGVRVEFVVREQPFRSFEDIRRLIGSGDLDPVVRTRSLEVFRRLAEAESRVHCVPVDQVHFHEIGAADSILDIVGAVAALQQLGIERVFASPLPLGRGFVQTRHGALPIPAPATVALLEGIPVYDNGIERELVTPTGAALLGALVESFGPMPPMVVRSVGYGVGSHPQASPPNVLRIVCGKEWTAWNRRKLLMIETNIDDMNPEFYDHTMEQLLSLGVLDVSLVPMQMKKNRPGILLRILCDPSLQAPVAEVLFRETTSLGIRIQEVERIELPREVKVLETPHGPCRVKEARLPGGAVRFTPEYDDCKRIAKAGRLPLRQVYEEISLLAGGRK